MDDHDKPSRRLVEQRLRNRTMEALETLAGGDDGVRASGNAEYINQFFDNIDDPVRRWRGWSTFTGAEVEALDNVQQVVLDACAATPRVSSYEDFIASGWPGRIKPAASSALALMRERGRFREDRDEELPSGTE